MTDHLAINAERVLARLEPRLGVTATYTKRGVDVVDDDGNITSVDVDIPCTLLPKEVTQDDMALAGMSNVETQMRVFVGRHSVLGNGLSRRDIVTVGGIDHEVLAPVMLDALEQRWRIIARKIT